MRRGISVIEIVALLPLVVAVLLLCGQLFPAVIQDLPKLQQVALTNRVLSHMLQRLQEDIDAAKSLPKTADGKTANEKLLLIESPGILVTYQVADDRIIRRQFSDNATEQAGQAYTWPVSKAKLSLHRWPSSDSAYAIEVRRAVQYSKQGRDQDKLANTHVFYLSALPSQEQRP